MDRLGEVAATTDVGVFVYDNSRGNWKLVAPAVSDASITAAYYDPTAVSYEGTGGDGRVLLRLRHGDMASIRVFPTSVMSLGMDNEGNLYAGAGDGIYTLGSLPGTWLRQSDGLGHGAIHQIRTSVSNKMLYTAGDNGLFYWSNERNEWIALTNQPIYDFAEASARGYAATTSGRILTADNMLTIDWQFVQTLGLPFTSIYTLVTDSSNNIFAGTGSDGVFRAAMALSGHQ